MYEILPVILVICQSGTKVYQCWKLITKLSSWPYIFTTLILQSLVADKSFWRKTSRCALECTNELIQIVRQAKLIFITFLRLHVSTLFIGHLQPFIHWSLQLLCMLGSHHVHINKIYEINYVSQLKSDWEVLSGGVESHPIVLPNQFLMD